LTTGFILSIFIEYKMVKNGRYNISQQLSPSKLWRTFIFAIVFYWISSSLIALILTPHYSWTYVLLCISIIGFLYNVFLDWSREPSPDNHLEGTYIPWEWHVRKQK
jgi:predicted CDP-diglyceride synthetase/phosphatidate cytidylyltransferase